MKRVLIFASFLISGMIAFGALQGAANAAPFSPLPVLGKSVDTGPGLVIEVKKKKKKKRIYPHIYRQGCWVDRWGQWHCQNRRRHRHPTGCTITPWGLWCYGWG